MRQNLLDVERGKHGVCNPDCDRIKGGYTANHLKARGFRGGRERTTFCGPRLDLVQPPVELGREQRYSAEVPEIAVVPGSSVVLYIEGHLRSDWNGEGIGCEAVSDNATLMVLSPPPQALRAKEAPKARVTNNANFFMPGFPFNGKNFLN